MPKNIDSKTLLLIVLAASAAVLTFVREQVTVPRQSTETQSVRETLPRKEISSIVDSTLKRMSVPMEKIHRSNISVGDVQGVREELRGTCSSSI